MNTLHSNIVRQKATVETVFELPRKVLLCGPREDTKSNLYVCSQAGEIIKFNEKGEYSNILSITGQPNCLAFDNHDDAGNENTSKVIGNNNQEENRESFFFTDVANSIIYYKNGSNNKTEVLVKDYEGNPLKGPTSLTYNSEDGSLILCDGGYFESTSLGRPYGSIFHFDLESHTLTPIILNCLAYPSDIIFDWVLGIGYVAETFNNRILRITENPTGVYHTSVFYIFNGRVGPTALAMDEYGNIYASRFEYQNSENTVDGLISVINKDGYLIGELEVPKMSEITGLYIPKKIIDDSKEENNQKNINTNTLLYFTEKNFNGVKKIKLNQFINDIDKS